jgi:hypothetical protein
LIWELLRQYLSWWGMGKKGENGQRVRGGGRRKRREKRFLLPTLSLLRRRRQLKLK